MKRIGLIAMSGVRAHNEELTRLGLTLPGFVDRNRIIATVISIYGRDTSGPSTSIATSALANGTAIKSPLRN